MLRSFLLAIILFVTTFANAQDNKIIRHTVEAGETITRIAAKYKVTPYDIYRLNPDAQKGISPNDIILVPVSPGQQTTSIGEPVLPKTQPKQSAEKLHVTKTKETFYSIARTYEVDVNELMKINPEAVRDGLKVGQEIKIPTKMNQMVQALTPTQTVAATPALHHIVEAKETKFGIAKKYNITVDELEKLNPEIKNGLPIGFDLIVKNGDSGKAIVKKPEPKTAEIEQGIVNNIEVFSTIKSTVFANYEVKPKETLFSLAQEFRITQQELINLNPTLKEGVRTGMILKVPATGSITLDSENAKKVKDLTKTIQYNVKKRMVILLPFNVSKIQNDSLRSTTARLKKDAFLNMTLDFYSGALMAIDSAKTLGMNIDVDIYDSEENTQSSNIDDLFRSKNLSTANVVIGPFYQQYVEKLAGLLNPYHIPVVSPLSKETVKPYSNLYQSMPSTEYGKKTVLDFMFGQGANVIVVSDPKRAANREMIQQLYPSVKFAINNEYGNVDGDHLKSLFRKDVTNYVIIDSEKTGMILSTSTIMMGELSNYNLQLVILEPNETLDFDEISMKRLAVLKLVYPSMTRENSSPRAMSFANAYKAKNKSFPNQYATRGFDVTFDTMIRMSQGKPFSECAVQDRTEEMESKYEYVAKDNDGYINKGVYILELQDDLTVKQLN